MIVKLLGTATAVLTMYTVAEAQAVTGDSAKQVQAIVEVSQVVARAAGFTGFPASQVRTTDGVQAVVVSVDSVELPTAFFRSHGIERLWAVTFDSVLLTEGVRDSALGRRVDKTVARTFTVLADSATGCLVGAVSKDWGVEPPKCWGAWSGFLNESLTANGPDIHLPCTSPAVSLAQALTVGFDLPVSIAEGIYAFYVPWIVTEDAQRIGMIPGDTAAVWVVVTGHCTAGRKEIGPEGVPCPGFAFRRIDAMTGKPVGIRWNRNIGMWRGEGPGGRTKPKK